MTNDATQNLKKFDLVAIEHFFLCFYINGTQIRHDKGQILKQLFNLYLYYLRGDFHKSTFYPEIYEVEKNVNLA